jgi:K+-transporting ATPase c subunit
MRKKIRAAIENGWQSSGVGHSGSAINEYRLDRRFEAAAEGREHGRPGFQPHQADRNREIGKQFTSASALDPDVPVAAAEYQVPSVAHARGLPRDQVEHLVQTHIEPRQLGFLGEPRANVLEPNLALDAMATHKK